jgi:hypothetical protein
LFSLQASNINHHSCQPPTNIFFYLYSHRNIIYFRFCRKLNKSNHLRRFSDIIKLKIIFIVFSFIYSSHFSLSNESSFGPNRRLSTLHIILNITLNNEHFCSAINSLNKFFEMRSFTRKFVSKPPEHPLGPPYSMRCDVYVFC